MIRRRFTRPLFGPMRAKKNTGVPADHFRKASEMRYGDGINVLIADGPDVLVASASGKTDWPIADRDTAWSGSDASTNCAKWASSDGSGDKDKIDWGKYKTCFFWFDEADDNNDAGENFNDYKLGFVDIVDDKPTAIPKGIFAVAASLQGSRGGVDLKGDDDPVKKKVAAYYTRMAAQFKDKTITPPWEDDSNAVHSLHLIDIDGTQVALSGDVPTSAELAEAKRTGVLRGEPLAALHPPFTGRHSHNHSSFGSQAGDKTHAHSHSHNGDSAHGHSHGASVQIDDTMGTLGLRVIDHEGADDMRLSDDDTAALVASALARAGEAGLTAATKPDGTIEPEAWHAILCVEGVRTDDGRELCIGSCSVPDLPISLRLVVEDEGGHWGAVTCGRVDTIVRQENDGYNEMYGEGMFGSDENGQLAELLVTEQTQRFISIDPRDVVGQWIEVQVSVGSMYDCDGDDDADMYDCWFQYTSCVIGAASIVAMPAYPQAVITLASVPLPETPIADSTAPVGLLASAAMVPDVPPKAWFENPGFHVGDPRLVKQRYGGAACPLTVTEDGRVFGHVAFWQSEHTGMSERRTPPRSRTGYAFFRTGVVETAEGETVTVGQLTMGCGHASTSPSMSYPAVQSHYDLGYGAVQMASVAAGEDDYGIWVAGALRPGVTDEQIRDFKSLNLSGDWRHLGGTRGDLEMVAVLAVPVPGFPISRTAIAASAAFEPTSAEDGTVRAGVRDDVVMSLVAAGSVQRMSPAQRFEMLERQIDELRAQVRPLTRDRLGRSI